MRRGFTKLKRNIAFDPTKKEGRLRRAARHPIVAVPLATFSALLLLLTLGLVIFGSNNPAIKPVGTNTVILTDDGQERTVPTRARTVEALLERLNIKLNEGDVVEPSKDTKITSDNFRVNVYRGLPVTIVDGDKNMFTFSAATT